MTGLGRELEGLTVVSIEQAVAAPYCGLLLADAGARVIKVERPDGDFARAYDSAADGESSYFMWLNRGKESIALDLDIPADGDLLAGMLDRADIFLHNLSPGALERRGFGHEALGRTNPRLVSCEITGYGRAGAAAGMKAYDLLVQAETGLCSITGTPDGPARVGVSLCDIATGLTAFSGILRALLRRAVTGQGMALSVSMFDVLADWMNVPLLHWRATGQLPPRLGVSHATLAPYGLYSVQDGTLLIGVQSNREWAALCSDVLGKPELTQDPRFLRNDDRVSNRSAMDEEIGPIFARMIKSELIARLDGARIAYANLNDIEQLSNHSQLRQIEARLGSARVSIADLPIVTDQRSRDVPALDAHGAALRHEFKKENEDG
ncbi:carnitine dehydratase [Sphingobium lactosutens]|uniref:CaiB/BaiF CoA transferase family protein n=1 Tax=Sphingobium lactosutens TaxID=522773 RepID=UPI0015BF445F|nr:CaiB/BaiF CoA-transferase family protein [Sphingobium lactosutens]NWK97480.1 carnitine dehydratase [Sphingobium lactosutens]